MPKSSGHVSEVLWEDGEFVLSRDVWDGEPFPLLALTPASAEPSPGTLSRLQHAYTLREELDPAWAARPLRLEVHRGRLTLLVADPGGEPLSRLLGQPWETAAFLSVAVGLASALGRFHERGLIHKDVNPANILVDATTSAVWLTGFGIASRLPRERQVPAPPEVIAGTLAYMAPEQTGRMNRSVDARSDLYALGVTFYEMLTGGLPFTASDPMEWVHCHIARRPPPPEERVAFIQKPLSAIVMKLLAKTAEDRYQTAAGLTADLRRCLADWEPHARIESFPLGANDASGRLLIPEKLYGRQHEIETLLAAFDRVVANGATELVLVSGYSGIGKSAVVNELHKVLVPLRGLFASGKFDQYKRDVPYATLAQAFQSLIRPLLGKSEAQLGRWRDALREALGPNGQLIVNLVPELELVIGKQPPVPDLPPQDGQNRFQTVFRRFINVFARPEHPLALFLDDLQWLDAATLDLLKHLTMHSEVRHLLLVGAYRDNEVDSLHPLPRTLEAIRKTGAQVQEIVLAPLGLDDVGQLVADALHSEPERVRALAQLVQEKTLGNPFFAIQFLTALADEGLVAFAADAAAWRWNIERIRAKGYTDNLADLMTGKLNGLPGATLETLKQLACLGNSAHAATVSMVLGVSEEELHAVLWPVVWAGLVFHLDGAYSFVHDRVQEAAYALIPADERPAVHLRIGRELLSRTPTVELEEKIFEIVNQLNRGAKLIHSREERERLAELNLVAGRRAKSSTAYASALMFFAAGGALLSKEDWQGRYSLAFALAVQQAECEYLTGDLASAENRLATLSILAENLVDSAAVTCLKVELYTNLDRADRAVEIGLRYLRQVGVEWAMHPTDDEVAQEYARIWRQLGSRTVGELINLPPMTDPDRRATLDVLTSVHAPANFTDGNLLSLIIGRMANLSLEFGNGDGSCLAYTYLGVILESRFGDYRAGFQFGKLGVDLVEQGGLDRFKARVYLNFGNAINPWSRHVRTSFDLLNCAFDTAQERGDLTFVAYSFANLISADLVAGNPLSDVQRRAEIGLALVQKAQFGTGVDLILGQLGFIRALRGLTPDLSSFNTVEFDEHQFERHLDGDPGLAMPACWYWIRKLESRFYAGDYPSAVAAASKAESMLWTSPAFLVLADYHFYAALARSALYESASDDERPHISAALEKHHEQLRIWADNCPENFENRAALVGAEIARIGARDLDAMRLYEHAIRSARQCAFVHQEALANELAARFHEARGFETISNAYLRNARYCYLRWGADGKVRQLDRLHPHLAGADGHRQIATNGSATQQLDVATVVKASQALSSEIVLPKLIERLMTIAIENAGADRGLLIFPAEGANLIQAEARIEAEAATDGQAIVVRQREARLAGAALPESIVHYVARTRERVILDDASAGNPFSADAYIGQHGVRSVLCLPLIKQAALVGVLYLENSLASHVFTPARVALLELLASQAAISLENTRLYVELEEREAKIRRLVDANIMGIFIWNLEGEIIEANDAFLQMVGYRREDFSSGRIRWTDLTPPEWRDSDLRTVAALKATGTKRPSEKEFYRKDGSRAPVLVGSAAFGGRRDEGVSFVVDLTERKQSEAQARETERRYREVQLELEHANRVATMGQLSASIAHEVNQPIAAAVTNTHAALRWLDVRPPNLEKARQALGRILENGNRAGEVIAGIRALIRKEPARQDRLTMNETILEVIALTQGEALKYGVSVRTQLAKGLPVIEGDKVQLQQVILNLIINAIQAMTGVDEGLRELLISTDDAVSEGVLVAVADSGPGLAPAAVERLFEAFYTTKPSGLGMGLPICRTIVEAHGGRLWATANVPRGAVFQFTVPIRAEPN